MKKLVFLVVLSIAACLSAQISVNHPDEIPDFIQVDVNEASNMVFTGEPNYKGNNLGDFNEGFICDNNTYAHGYWKVGDTALVVGPNEPNITPQLTGDGSLVLVFRLPVKDGADKVLAAHLFTYVGWISGIESVDLYGLRTVRAEDVDNTDPNKAVMVKQSDYFVGSFGCDPNATFIQTEYIQRPYSASVNKWHMTGYDDDANGPNRLRCWLQKQYDEGAEGGDYVLLRLNISGHRTIVPPAIVAGLPSYHQIQVSTMWDNPTYDVKDPCLTMKMPLSHLEKTFDSSPRLFIQFTSGTPAACPNAVAYCCSSLPGDVTGNCHVDTNDLKIIADSWLEVKVEVSEANLLSRYSFESEYRTEDGNNWGNSVAGALDANARGRAHTESNPEKGRVADLHNDPTWLWVGYEPAFNRATAYDANDANGAIGITEDANDTNGISTQITVAIWINTARSSWQRVMGWGNTWYLNPTATNGSAFWVVRHNVIPPDMNAPPGQELLGKIEELGGTLIADSKWHHLAGTYNAVTGVQNLYIDGKLDNTQTHHAADSIYMSYNFYTVGAKGNYTDPCCWEQEIDDLRCSRQDFHGWLDEVRVYNRALSATEIAILADTGTPADITKNGIVNLVDFAALAENWLDCALFPNPATECLK